MNESHPRPIQFSLSDIYHTLFRQKWKILIVLTLSLAAATWFYFTLPTTYESQAKVYIKYIQERKSPTARGGIESADRSPDPGGYNIMNSEIEILTSQDLAELVAEAVGPEKILDDPQMKSNKVVAGSMLIRNLRIEVPLRASVIRLSYRHKNPEVAQKVLQQMVQSYQDRHREIHRAPGLYDDVLSQQTDTLREKLNRTEEDIRKLKAKIGVISVEDALKASTAEMARIKQEIFQAEAELAARKAAFQSIQKIVPGADPSTNGVPTPEQMDKLDAYQKIIGRQADLEEKETTLLGQYTEDHPLVKAVRGQMEEIKKKKEAMEKETPGLSAMRSRAGNRPNQPSQPAFNPEVEMGRIAEIEARMKKLGEQFEKTIAEARSIDEVSTTYAELQRRKQLEETNLFLFFNNLELARINDALGPGKISNLSVVQSASLGMKVPGIRKKVCVGIMAGGMVLALLLAFVSEHLFDQTIKRPIEVEKKLRLPMMLWIPEKKLNGKASRKELPAPSRLQLGAGQPEPGGANLPAVLNDPPGGVAPWDADHELRDYYEALRDRLITYFEIRNMTHKPKLVAVTGCSEGSGVTSIATGLAATLSETGDGNVLLVDMNFDQGAAHHFHQGKPARSLAEALEEGGKDGAMVQEKLYLASGQGSDEKLPRILPKAFTQMLPRMKASDFDYIIFDMPPVSQTSATSRLARHMDMTLLVIHAEKDHKDAVKRAAASLNEAKANVSALLNRKRDYVPGGLVAET